MTTTANPPYRIRQVDLSDLALLKEIMNKKQKKADFKHMPFLILIQNDRIAAFSSVTISDQHDLGVEISYDDTIPDTLSQAFSDKVQSFFDQQLIAMFGSEESLKRGVSRFSDWINQNGNSKLA